MDTNEREMDNFFYSYANRINNGLKGGLPDIEGTAKSFSNCFIAASPAGISCGQNDDSFRAAIPKGYEFYKNIGIKSMDIISKEITVLDDFHTIAKVKWKSSFVKKDKSEGSIEFENIYFMQTKNGEHKIFAYITGDEEAALKEHGLI
jgi:hypothetical protein